MRTPTAPSSGISRFARHKILVDEYLENLEFSADPQLGGLVEAMRYSLLAGGKRLRPALCMESARTFGLDPVEVLPSAAAIEFIHTFSLIHDDLPAMDNDDFRRGIPTNHKRFGGATAILAGDGFFGESLTLITVHQKGTAEQILEVVRELAYATGVGGMVGGQALDIAYMGRDIDPETLTLMHCRKTGALTKASARIGAVLAGASPEEQSAISQFAMELGLCFQIVDDILDATSTVEKLGKPVGSDAESGKATFVGVYGLSGARRLADETLLRALEALGRLGADAEDLAGFAHFVRHRDR
jgi:geranylgeranyl diphosphate synthase type II